MRLNETIWGAPSTYKSVTQDSQYNKIKTPNITYSDVVAAHPELQFPYFEKSTYRWSVPSDSSIGHYSTCSWWAAAGTTSIRHEVKEPTPQGVVGLTFTANASPSTVTLSIRNAPYAENVDAVMKFPPYTKMAAQVTNQSGTVTYTGASTVNYSHKISYKNYANTWDGAFPIVSKLSYKDSVIALYGSYLNEKGNYVNGNLVQSDVPAVFTGELDSLISNMRARYEADLAAERDVEPEDYKLTGISAQYYLLNGNGTYRFTPANGCPYACAFSFYEPSQRWKLRYYDDPDLAATNLFTSSIGSGFMVGTGAGRNTNPAVQSNNFGYRSYSSLPTPSTFFNGATTVWNGGEDSMSPCERSYRCSSKKQQFPDVSYHWEWRLRLQYESLKFEDVPTLPSSSSGKYSQIVLHPVLVIDSFDSSLGDYFAAVRRACLHEMAFLGLPMVTNENAAMYELWTTSQTHVYIPQFDSHMVTTGQFLTLAESYTADPEGQYTWDNIYGDVEEINDYDPDYQPDGPVRPRPDPDPNPILPSTPAFTLAGRGTQCYAITPADMTEIFDDIYGRSSGSFDDLVDGLKLFGSDPMGAIISYKWYPFQFNSAQSAPIVLGTTEINPSHTYPIVQNVTSSFIQSKGVFWYGRDKNFVESQETTARLFLPFYGFYELPMPQVLSKELELEFHYNVPDEVGVWIISFGDVIYDYLECDCSIEIPLTGNNARAIRQAKIGAAISIGAQVAGTVATMMVARGATKAANGLMNGILTGITGSMAAMSGKGDSQFWSTMISGIHEASNATRIGTNINNASKIAGALSGASGIYNTVSQIAQQINHLKVNVPFHGAADATTFLNLPMYPYIQFFQHQLIQGYNENEYRLKVGHACHKYCTITEMPENSLLQATGMANMSSMGMELEEVQELNQILQTGFYYTSY